MKEYGIKHDSKLGSTSFSIPMESLQKAVEGKVFMNTYNDKAAYTVVVREVSEWEEV